MLNPLKVGMLNFNSIEVKLLLIAFVVAPIDGLAILSIMRENLFFGFSYIYPISCGIIVLLLRSIINGDFEVCIKHEKPILMFLLIAVLSVVVNISSIIYADIGTVSGIKRSLNNIINIIIMFSFFTYYRCVMSRCEMNYLVDLIVKGIRYSYYISIVFSFFQILNIMDIDLGRAFIENIEGYFNYQAYGQESVNLLFRVYGASQEASTFGGYILVAFPWLVYDAVRFNSSLYKKIIAFSVLPLVVLSFSRIAIFGVLVEIIVLYYMLNAFDFMKIVKQFGAIFIGAFAFVVGMNQVLDVERLIDVLVSFDPDNLFNSTQGVSNATRLGMQITAINMFCANPWFGVGAGQFGFNAISFIPSFSLTYSYEVVIAFIDQTGKMLGTNNTHLRVLAELGMCGFTVWGYMIVSTINHFLKYKRNINPVLGKVMLISFIGACVSLVNFDTYSNFYFWTLMALGSTLKRFEV